MKKFFEFMKIMIIGTILIYILALFDKSNVRPSNPIGTLMWGPTGPEKYK